MTSHQQKKSVTDQRKLRTNLKKRYKQFTYQSIKLLHSIYFLGETKKNGVFFGNSNYKSKTSTFPNRNM